MAIKKQKNIKKTKTPKVKKSKVKKSVKKILKLDKKSKKELQTYSSKLVKSNKKEIEKGLKKIYQDDKGKMPKMTGLEFKEKNKTLKSLIILIFVLSILFFVSFIGFLTFQPTPKFNGSKINIEIKGPFNVISGESISYELKYTNSEDIDLTNTNLEVYLPNGFIFDNASITPEIKESDTNSGFSNIKTWRLDDIKQNETKSLTIEGKLIGNINSKQTISATLSYIPSNFSSEFQKTISFNTEINDSLLELDLEYSKQTANEDETEFNFKIINNSNEIDLSDIELEFNYPEEFTLLRSQIIDPRDNQDQLIEEDLDNNEIKTQKIWAIDNLLYQNDLQIKLQGKFDVHESTAVDLGIKLKLRGPDNEYFVQRDERITIDIIKGELLTNLIVQGSNQNKAVNFEDRLSFLLNIQNKSKTTLGDLKVRAVIDSKLLDWSSLDDSNDGLLESGQILWTKDQIPELAVLFPEEEIDIMFQIDLKDYQSVKKYNSDDLQIRSFFEAQINKIDNQNTQTKVESNTIINDVNSNLSLNAQARYFDDNNRAVGSGPLPPIIGQETSYKIYWEINNSLHEIKNIELKADLPDYVQFNDNQNISTGSLFRKDNQIIWQISRTPETITSSKAEFEISINPSSDDVHKILNLLSDIKLTATDSQTNTQIEKTLAGLTTNLDGDPLGESKGLIQE